MSDILKAEEKLGQKAEAFLRTDIGRLISGKAEQDLEQAKEDLLNLDPYAYSHPELQNHISKLQLNARVAQRVKDYIDEAIISGRQASQQLTEVD